MHIFSVILIMEDNMQKKLNFALHSLKLIGHFESPFLSKLYGFSFLAFAIVLLFGAITGFMNHTKLSDRLEIFCSSFGDVCAIIFYININGNLKILTQFLSRISQNQSYDDDIRIKVLQITIEKAETTIFKFCIIIPFFLGIVFVAMCSIIFLPEVDYRNKNLYFWPYQFQCTDDGVNRFPLQFLCTNRETFLNFFVTNFLVAIFFVWAVAVCFLWPFVFLLCFRIFIDANISVIRKTLLQLGDNSGNRRISADMHSSHWVEDGNKKEGIESDVAKKTLLLKVVRYHRYLFRTIKDIVPIIEKISDFYLILSIVNTAAAFYTVRSQEKVPGYWNCQIRYTGSACIWLMIFFTNTYCAQIISDMQADIMNAVYFTPWYEENIEFCKLMSRFLTLLQTPFKLKSLGMYSTNLNLFARTMRNSYSALNLMLAQLKGK